MADNDFETVLNKQGLADQWPFLRRVIHFNLQYVKKGRREFIHIAPPESVIADKVFQFEGARGMALRDVLRFQGRKARKVTLKGDDVFKVVKEWQLSGQDDKTIYKLATKYGPMGSHVWRFQVRETERFGQFLGDGGRERLAETPLYRDYLKEPGVPRLVEPLSFWQDALKHLSEVVDFFRVLNQEKSNLLDMVQNGHFRLPYSYVVRLPKEKRSGLSLSRSVPLRFHFGSEEELREKLTKEAERRLGIYLIEQVTVRPESDGLHIRPLSVYGCFLLHLLGALSGKSEVFVCQVCLKIGVASGKQVGHDKKTCSQACQKKLQRENRKMNLARKLVAQDVSIEKIVEEVNALKCGKVKESDVQGWIDNGEKKQ